MADQLFNGRCFRALTIVDNYSRTYPGIHIDTSIKGTDVAQVVEQVYQRYTTIPDRIQVDNSSELISKALDRWA